MSAAASDVGVPDGSTKGIAWSILDLARWAPSGDNTQPWRFEVISDDHVVVHAFDTRRHCVYDIDGRASQVSVGALLETVRIAATVHGRRARDRCAAATSLTSTPSSTFASSERPVSSRPLHLAIRRRSVQRRSLSTRPLDDAAKKTLAEPSVPGTRWSGSKAGATLAHGLAGGAQRQDPAAPSRRRMPSTAR